jgi:hypothetical protein
MSIGNDSEDALRQATNRRPPACYARAEAQPQDGDDLVDAQFKGALLVLSVGICAATFLVLHGGFLL